MTCSNETMLSMLRAGDGPVATWGGRSISPAVLLAETEELAGRLPDRSYVVNFCSNRYRFTVAWFAAMLRGQITLLPTTRDVGAITALLADYPALYVLADDDEPVDWPAPHFAYPALAPTGGAGRVPGFAPDQIAAVLFTSGSTGRPTPSVRRWGRLVAGSLAAGRALGVARLPGAPVIATVPHAHSYGLESAVMLPLQHGLPLTAERPFFPADVAAALDNARSPGILITTPVHLRALVGDAAGPGFGTSFRAAFVLSATAPLSAELAHRAEAAFSAPVFEIYGCSEAGQLATRRTTDGPTWRCLDGFRLYSDAAGCWAAGPAEPDVRLADEVTPAAGGGFVLQGRIADLVNIAGKRGSLAYLTRQLLAIDGVEDGVFLMPDEAAGVGEGHGTLRLAAVVLAPGLTAAMILTRLRQRIDPAFLPRPLHVVDSLPRNELGKLPRADVLRLLGSVAPRQLERASAAGSTAATLAPVILRFSAAHPSGPGHFPGNPIIPGAAILDELVAMISPGWCGTVEAAKFHHPVRPGDSVVVTHRTSGDTTRFECHLLDNRQLVLSGVLRAPSPSL